MATTKILSTPSLASTEENEVCHRVISIANKKKNSFANPLSDQNRSGKAYSVRPRCRKNKKSLGFSLTSLFLRLESFPPLHCKSQKMRRSSVFALAFVLACVASSLAQTPAVSVAHDQLTILQEIADQWPSLKTLSANSWNATNLANACTIGRVAYVTSCDATGWVTSLRFSPGQFFGSMAASLYKMASLRVLSLNNVINGTLDPNMGQLTQLHTLVIIGNYFSTPFPSQWSSLVNLGVFEYSNALDRPGIPFPSFLNGLPALHTVYLTKVNLTGSITEAAGQLPALSDFRLKEIPLLQGPIPTSLTQSSSITLIYFENLPSFSKTAVGVSSDLPSDWSLATQLGVMSFIDVPFTGSLPTNAIPKLARFYVSGAPLAGAVTQAFIDSPLLSDLQIVNTSVSGILPSVTDKENALLETLQVAHSKLSGLSSDILENKNLLSVDFSNNLVAGTMPTVSGQRSSSLYSLRMSNNNLIGSIPSSLFINAPNIVVFEAENNQLDGSIPMSLAEKTNWAIINVGNNKLNGSIPDAGKWQISTTTLSISFTRNMLEGTIPFGLLNRTTSSFFSVLDVSRNRLDICKMPPNFVIPENRVNSCQVDQQTPKECGCAGKWPEKCTSNKPIPKCASDPSVSSAPAPVSSYSTSLFVIVLATFASFAFF